MKKKLFIGFASVLGLLILYGFWSNANIEARRQKMWAMKPGMSRAEIVSLLSDPDYIRNESGKDSSCVTLSYNMPSMAVTVCHDSATSASFYEGKAEITIFE